MGRTGTPQDQSSPPEECSLKLIVMGLFIHSGQETQIAIYPQVTYTTNDAIGKLKL